MMSFLKYSKYGLILNAAYSSVKRCGAYFGCLATGPDGTKTPPKKQTDIFFWTESLWLLLLFCVAKLS